MRTQRTIRATFGLMFLFFLSGLISFSKTDFLSILADAQALQEVSPIMGFPQPSLDEKRLVKAHAQFGFQLFSTLVKANPEQNVFVSPTSVALTLSMLYNGATGDTKTEIAQALGIQGVEVDALNRANQTLESDLNLQNSQSPLIVANSLWARQGFTFRYQFLKNNRDYYQDQITNLNFASAEAKGIINRWVTDNTEGKIKNIINKIQADDVLFLINTAYFQGSWQVGFDKKLTTDKPFYVSPNTSKPYPFMSRQGTYHYLENSQFQAIKLPYGDGQFSLSLVLPKNSNQSSQIFQDFTPKKWQKLSSKFRQTSGLLQLPRFTLNYEVDLTKTLQSLGLSTMFNPSQAGFSKLTSHSAYINGIKHQALVEFNENGKQLPSVKSMNLKVASIISSQPQFTMIVDRPFFCLIQDENTGAILFMGSIFTP
ncbi:serpin family protein [Crocosphaera sp. XPORK-15E]|uniref:serpin family protein n=1 Tax=Crocosphaera sp. XPORK-15E TaxID=3110247 RepID=UPI002B202E79|nr:serpin family protein [Crocosphaera sp. XPORK-15E]MEA5532911.1 serpin family protein [Crocosphaera sp. XPORK-15E]